MIINFNYKYFNKLRINKYSMSIYNSKDRSYCIKIKNSCYLKLYISYSKVFNKKKYRDTRVLPIYQLDIATPKFVWYNKFKREFKLYENPLMQKEYIDYAQYIIDCWEKLTEISVLPIKRRKNYAKYNELPEIVQKNFFTEIETYVINQLL